MDTLFLYLIFQLKSRCLHFILIEVLFGLLTDSYSCESQAVLCHIIYTVARDEEEIREREK